MSSGVERTRAAWIQPGRPRYLLNFTTVPVAVVEPQLIITRIEGTVLHTVSLPVVTP